MSAAITVRLATEPDLPAIMEIIKAVVPMMQASGNFQWDSQYPLEDNFRTDIADGVCYVAEVESTLVGVAGNKLYNLCFIEPAQADPDSLPPTSL